MPRSAAKNMRAAERVKNCALPAGGKSPRFLDGGIKYITPRSAAVVS